MKRLPTLFFFLLSTLMVMAQTVSVQVPSNVQCGENFRLSYVINTQNVENFRAGEMPDGLEVISGPYTSRVSNYKMINGHSSRTSSLTYTYTLYAAKNGTYTIPAAKAVIDGKTVHSEPAKVVVSGTATQQGRQGQPRMHGQQSEDNMRTAGTPITGNDLFIRVSANKTKVREQEPILLTYKVYTQVDLTQLDGKMPDLTGFHSQELESGQQKSWKVETVDGRPYKTVTWSQYVMYPQMTGKMEIPSINFKASIVQRVKNIDPFEAFFNGGSSYQEVERTIKTSPLTINVEPLPERPADFSGGVGQFKLSATVDKTKLKAGDPVTYTVMIEGVGNLKLIKTPTLTLPKDFDKYDPKVTDKTHLTAAGLEGRITYEYLIVPRNQGQYTIPALQFVYFDTTEGKYKTVATEPFTLQVEKGSGRSVVADFSADRDNDIHDLKTGNSKMMAQGVYFFGSTAYLLWLCIPICIFAIIVYIFRKRAQENANIVMMKGKKANKVAIKRLKTAAKLMSQNNEEAFYDEVLRALWGYTGDKLSMPVEQLSRENITEKFSAVGVDSNTVAVFVEAIDECEFARYAPGEAKGKMDTVYSKAVTAITDIDDMLKSNKGKNLSAMLIGIGIMLAISATADAKVTKQMADAEYAKGNYQEAIKGYNAIISEDGVSADLYYNLGNAYFRTDEVTKAVLAYERACKLSPGDEDIRFNLQFARSKTIDKIIPENEVFFVTWYKALVNSCTSDVWAIWSITMLIVMLISLSCYLFGSKRRMVKPGFYIAVGSSLALIATVFLAWRQKEMSENHDAAIIVSQKVSVMKTPSQGAAIEMTLHEGTRVDITDRTMKGWRAIRLTDGREGWVKPTDIEEI